MAVYSFDLPTHNIQVSANFTLVVSDVVVRRRKIIPASHMRDSMEMEADAYVDLFHIKLSDGATTLYLKMNNTVDWNGNTYQGTGIKLDGVAQYSDAETARPKLMLFNPARIYHNLVDQGYLEGGEVIRYRVLKSHIDGDIPIFTRQRWRLSRVASLRGDTITCELRDMMDGQNFTVPGRMYIPPAFPAVSL